MKALEILERNQSNKERASEYLVSIKRNLKKNIIDELVDQIDKIQDKINDLRDMSLTTDVNQGITAVTRDQAEKRFAEIIDLEYDLFLCKRELKIKKESYTNYFGKDKSDKVED